MLSCLSNHVPFVGENVLDGDAVVGDAEVGSDVGSRVGGTLGDGVGSGLGSKVGSRVEAELGTEVGPVGTGLGSEHNCFSQCYLVDQATYPSLAMPSQTQTEPSPWAP